MRVRVKICGIQSASDLDAAVNGGADAVGFLVGRKHVSNDFLSVDACAALVGSVPLFVSPVLVTHFTGFDDVRSLIERTGVRTVQLHAGADVGVLKALRGVFGCGLRLYLGVHVTDRVPEFPAADVVDAADGFVLDSCDPSADRIGGTGMVHDWSFSREFVARSSKPVVLAGGLNGDNVGSAVRRVRPYGVDVNSGVRGKDGGKLPELCERFVRNANDI